MKKLFKYTITLSKLTLALVVIHFFTQGVLQIETYLNEQIATATQRTVETIAEASGYVKPVPIVPQYSELSILEMAEREALHIGLNPSLVKAVIKTETGTRDNESKISPAGALGVMQVMPFHAVKFCKLKSWLQLGDAELNIKCGCKILKSEWEATNHNLIKTLRRYNGGPRCENGGCTESEAYWMTVMQHFATDIG